MYHSSGSLEDQIDSAEVGSAPKANSKPTEGQLRKFPEEEDEDILKESNARFVLFPIRYREVC